MKKIKLGIVSLGCSKNQVDAEFMLGRLSGEKYEILPEPGGGCDALVINTCGFIDAAKREAIDEILDAASRKDAGEISAIVVTGCLAERYRDEILSELPEIDAVLGIGSGGKLAEAIDAALRGEKYADFGDKANVPESGDRFRFTRPHHAFLKIADGCDNRCSYCAIPAIRGSYRSKPMDLLLTEAGILAAAEVTELDIVAQDTTRYGEDLYGENRLPELMDALARISGLRRIRLLYCYPDRVTDRLLGVMAAHDNIVNYIDLPLQHADDAVLSKMNRRQTRAMTDGVLARIRNKLPGAVIRTTFMVGFPGETEEQFETLLDYVATSGFDRLGGFAFSSEEGTAAAEMEDDVDPAEKERRLALLLETQEASLARRTPRDGEEIEVVIDGLSGGIYIARSAFDTPDADGLVFVKSDIPLSSGEYVTVRVDETAGYDLYATCLSMEV